MLNQLSNAARLTLVAIMNHAHLAAFAVDTRIIRDGVDIGPIFNNRHYDFKYQQFYVLNPFVNITKV